MVFHSKNIKYILAQIEVVCKRVHITVFKMWIITDFAAPDVSRHLENNNTSFLAVHQYFMASE